MFIIAWLENYTFCFNERRSTEESKAINTQWVPFLLSVQSSIYVVSVRKCVARQSHVTVCANSLKVLECNIYTDFPFPPPVHVRILNKWSALDNCDHLTHWFWQGFTLIAGKLLSRWTLH